MMEILQEKILSHSLLDCLIGLKGVDKGLGDVTSYGKSKTTNMIGVMSEPYTWKQPPAKTVHTVDPQHGNLLFYVLIVQFLLLNNKLLYTNIKTVP